MKKEDFTLNRIDETESKKELTNRYIEKSVIDVSECVYSKIDGMVGVKRFYLVNHNVIIVSNDNLKAILVGLTNI